MLDFIRNKQFYLGMIIMFLSVCIALLILFPDGRSFFVINGMHAPFLDAVMPHITHIGDGIVAVIVGVLLLVFYRLGSGTAVLLGTGICGLLTSLLKNYVFVDAPRPKLYFWGNKMIHYISDDYYVNIEHSFPSGHSFTAFFLFGFLVFSGFVKSVPGQIALALLAIVAAYSRTYLAHHFVGDITAGAVLGTGIAFGMNYFYFKLKRKPVFRKSLIQALRK